MQRFAGRHGKPNLYHETITWSYMMIIHDRMQASADAARDWDDFAAAHPDLFWPWEKFLSTWYDVATLRSDRARAAFVFPDAG